MAEISELEFKVVMDDGPDSIVLGRISDLDLGFAVYTAAVAKFPKRTIYLRHGARIIRKHEGSID